MSQYEDALDESDDELRKLCHDAAHHLNKAELRRHQKISQLRLLPSTSTHNASKTSNKAHVSSSSENSSVERVTNEVQFRSRQGTSTGAPKRTTSRRKMESNGGGGSTDSIENGDDWKHISYAFQEAACYPILFQLNQQLQVLSSQLYEMEATNVLQLKLVYRARKRSWLAGSTGITFIGWIFLFSWPVILQILYNFYKRYYWS